MNRLVSAMATVLGMALPCPAQWTLQGSGTTERLRGLSVVSRDIAWASGSGGTVLRTVDGGRTWARCRVPDSADLDFRDIEAFDETTAFLLAVGEGVRSRILKTVDGGATWAVQFVNQVPEGFLDALAFWDERNGLALGDPVGGTFEILATRDGGSSWGPIPNASMPAALPGEAAFAASGTCLIARGEAHAWFATGGAGVARVFRTSDRGMTWTVHETPVVAGSPSSGLFSLAFLDGRRGVAVGGDFLEPAGAGGAVAWTNDGGLTWSAPHGTPIGGYRSAVAGLAGNDPPTLIAVGPGGADRSEDGGNAWRPLGDEGFHAVGFAGPDAGWAVGEGGVIARFGPPAR